MVLPYNLNRFGGGDRKPYYCEVEYLEGYRGPCIDTGITYKWGQNYEVYFSTSADSSFGSKMVFGIYGSTATDKMCFNCYQDWSVQSPVYGYFYSNPTSMQTTLENKSVNKIEFKNGGWYYNGVLKHSSSEISNPSNLRVFLFATPTTGNVPAFQFVGRIYSARVWDENGVLIRHLIPVLDFNMTPCMYDKVSNKLFYNAGSGSFTYGRQIHYVKYLESTGTQYIKTGVIPTINTETEEKILPIGNPIGTMSSFARWSYSPEYDTFGNYFTGSDYVIVYFGRYSNGKTANFRFDGGKEILIKNMKTYCSVNDVKTIVSREDVGWTNTTYPLYLFSGNNMGAPTAFSKIKMYHYKAWENDVLIRDYKPAVDENGIGFMFDRIEHVIYDNAGSGVFTYPDVELEYLDSTGTQYINTGYCPNAKTVLKEKVRYFSTFSSALSFSRWSGSPNYDTFATYWSYPYGFNFYYGRFSNSKVLSISASVDTDYDVEIGLTSIKVNGSSTTITRGTDEWTNTDYPLYLFCGNNIGTAAFYSQSRKYYFQIIEDGDLIMDLIPVLHNGVACMYDKVSDTYFTNSGTGTFNFKIKEKR